MCLLSRVRAIFDAPIYKSPLFVAVPVPSSLPLTIFLLLKFNIPPLLVITEFVPLKFTFDIFRVEPSFKIKPLLLSNPITDNLLLSATPLIVKSFTTDPISVIAPYTSFAVLKLKIFPFALRLLNSCKLSNNSCSFTAIGTFCISSSLKPIDLYLLSLKTDKLPLITKSLTDS